MLLSIIHRLFKNRNKYKKVKLFLKKNVELNKKINFKLKLLNKLLKGNKIKISIYLITKLIFNIKNICKVLLKKKKSISFKKKYTKIYLLISQQVNLFLKNSFYAKQIFNTNNNCNSSDESSVYPSKLRLINSYSKLNQNKSKNGFNKNKTFDKEEWKNIVRKRNCESQVASRKCRNFNDDNELTYKNQIRGHKNSEPLQSSLPMFHFDPNSNNGSIGINSIKKNSTSISSSSTRISSSSSSSIESIFKNLNKKHKKELFNQIKKKCKTKKSLFSSESVNKMNTNALLIILFLFIITFLFFFYFNYKYSIYLTYFYAKRKKTIK